MVLDFPVFLVFGNAIKHALHVYLCTLTYIDMHAEVAISIHP